MEAQIEKAIELREKANFKILTRLAQIIECSPHLRFQQILSNYKVCEKEHRRVFEALGSRAKAEYSDDQLSGLGFSSTSHNDVVVKVDNKSFKIIF